MLRFSSLMIGLLWMLAVGLTACGGSSASAQELPGAHGDPVAGQALFGSTCAACHGPDGQGLPGLGKNLVSSEFAAGLSDQELVEFIRAGRSAGDPLNTTGITMPPKGNNAALSDEELYHIVSYIRTLQQ